LESLACGTPVISIDCPGTRAIIQEDKNGFLFSLHAVDILVNKLEALLEKEAELKKIGELGRQDVRKRFNWLNILEKLEIIYQDAIKEQ
jgi:glycosyltransferase involved in cell wall biosynthesis